MLLDVVRRKGATAGNLDGMPLPCFDCLARILSVVEEGWSLAGGFARCLYCYDPQSGWGMILRWAGVR